ncbi:hypothetical protein NB836_031175, partial [Pseudomonas aeruginosa]|nr:hypothetical protein [Pseudomonas aeruginosa]
MAKTWIYAASAAAIGGALIGGWLLDPAPPEASSRIVAMSFCEPRS